MLEHIDLEIIIVLQLGLLLDIGIVLIMAIYGEIQLTQKKLEDDLAILDFIYQIMMRILD
jgi:hypothetical protein